jgi:hypothetical protein
MNVIEGMTIKEKRTHFDNDHHEKMYLAEKINKVETFKEKNQDDPSKLRTMWTSIYEQPSVEDAKIKLLFYAKENNIHETELNLYSDHDIKNIYAIKALHNLAVKIQTDEYGYKYLADTPKNWEMHNNIINASSIADAKQLYTEYEKKHPDFYKQTENGNTNEHTDFYKQTENGNTNEYPNGEGDHHNGEGEPDHNGEDGLCTEKVCDAGYKFRFKNTFKVATVDGRATFLLEELEPKIVDILKSQGQTIDQDQEPFNIMREVVHNWMFEFNIDGTPSRFAPLMKCDHDFSESNGQPTINIRTFPDSPFVDGDGSEKEISWYQCSEYPSEPDVNKQQPEKSVPVQQPEKPVPVQQPEKSVPVQQQQQEKSVQEDKPVQQQQQEKSEQEDKPFIPHDAVEGVFTQPGSAFDNGDQMFTQHGSAFDNVVDNSALIAPPGILGPSSLTPPDTRPVNIIITSNVGPYGQVANPPQPVQQQMNYRHEIGEKTNTQINKTMSFMEHVMTTSQK